MIPVCEPLLDAQSVANVRRAVESGWISSDGPFIAEFESRWAAYCGTEHGVAVCNGTAALAVAMQALCLRPGDEVILPSMTIISCVLAVIEAGCVPILVDCLPDTWCLDISQVEAKITPRTRAVMPVHLFGHPADMAPLIELADRHGLAIVEDAAQAHGAEYEGRRVGGIGTLGCFSFYANKIITTGEGGMVVTADPVLADRMRSLRNLCFRADRRFLHTEIGHNYRMTNLQAALGVAQIDSISGLLSRKRRIAEIYAELLGDLPGLSMPIERPNVRSANWMFAVVLDDAVPFDATEFAVRLRTRGVDSRPFFLGMHEQPALRERGLFKNAAFPITERLSRRGLYLPTGLTLTEEQIGVVCSTVHEILR